MKVIQFSCLLINAWTHLTSQLEHIFNGLQSFPPALNDLTHPYSVSWQMATTSSSSCPVFTSLFHSSRPSLSWFFVPGHTETSSHMGICLPNTRLLFLMAPQLTTAALTSPGEGFSAIFCFGDDAQTLTALFLLPTPPASHHNWAAPTAEDTPNSTPPNRQKLGYWGQVMLKLIRQS